LELSLGKNAKKYNDQRHLKDVKDNKTVSFEYFNEKSKEKAKNHKKIKYRPPDMHL